MGAKAAYETDPDAATRRIRRLLEDHDGVRVEFQSPAVADAVCGRLTVIERARVHLVWPDFPEWDLDEAGEAFVRTHNALRRH